MKTKNQFVLFKAGKDRQVGVCVLLGPKMCELPKTHQVG